MGATQQSVAPMLVLKGFMMPKFSCAVVMRRGLDIVEFAAGDEVPAWAIGKVGNHVLAIEESLSAPDFTKQDEATGNEPEGDKDGTETEPEADATAETASEDAAPDFTKAAPAKRRTARKQA